MRVTTKPATSTARARRLRRDGTPEEQLLWAHLRNRHLDGWKFSRQYPIGPFFADFVCREAALVVELDGGQHAGSDRDMARDRFFNRAGYGVLRFWNNEIRDGLDGVLTLLRQVLEGGPSSGLRHAPATLSHRTGQTET